MRILFYPLCIACLSGPAAAQSPADFGVTAHTPPAINTNPDSRYSPRMRLWQGIPSIERTAKGRLWATWYGGPLTEGDRGIGNHCVLVTSADDATPRLPHTPFSPISRPSLSA